MKKIETLLVLAVAVLFSFYFSFSLMAEDVREDNEREKNSQYQLLFKKYWKNTN